MVMMALVASPALAAFPGRNGMLAVAPLQGQGVLLMSPRGTGEHQTCPAGGTCPVVNSPRWSPDGQEITFSSSGDQGISIIYGDGSCLDCQQFGVSTLTSGSASMPAFTSAPGLLSTVSDGKVIDYGTDGLQKQTVLSGHVSDAVWSAQGELAVVRSGRVLAGRPGHLDSLVRGSDPSWSPGGSRLALVRRGRVIVVRVGHHSGKRLAGGSAPAFSPDGKFIAFIGAGHRLSVVPSGGGRVRRVGHVRGRYVDWQPIPSQPPAACTAPPGSTTVGTSSTGVITADSAPVPGYAETAPAYMGCLLSTGRERLLARYDFQSIDSASSASDFVIAGNFAAFIEDDSDPHYGGSSEVVHVFDLDNGAESNSLGGETVECGDYSYDCNSGAGQLVLNADGFSAVHTISTQFGGPAPDTAETTDGIVASDSSGVHIEDTASEAGSGFSLGTPSLTDLQLSGDTLTWLHAGSPRSATLQ